MLCSVPADMHSSMSRAYVKVIVTRKCKIRHDCEHSQNRQTHTKKYETGYAYVGKIDVTVDIAKPDGQNKMDKTDYEYVATKTKQFDHR